MGKLSLLHIAAILILGLALTCNATTYTVGDSSGWDISSDLDSWAVGKTFAVGDVLCKYLFFGFVLLIFCLFSLNVYHATAFKKKNKNKRNQKLDINVRVDRMGISVSISEKKSMNMYL